MKKKIIALCILTILSISVVCGLYLVSDNLSHRYNTFIRLVRPGIARNPKFIDIRYNSYYIAGFAGDHLYLGNTTNPRFLLLVDTNLQDTQKHPLRLPDLDPSGSHLIIDSPAIYLIHGPTHTILRGSLENLILEPYWHSPHPIAEATALSPTSIAIRTIDQNNVFSLSKNTPSSPLPLDSNTTNTFDGDGMLRRDPRSHTLVYTYYYRNTLLFLDTNLNVQHISHTIDTITTPHISVGAIPSEQQLTLSAPPLTVNKKSCVAGDYLFVNSSLLSRTESPSGFDNATAIDVYDIHNRIYKLSFYLPKQFGQKATDFQVFGHTLVATYTHYLFTYNLNIQ